MSLLRAAVLLALLFHAFVSTVFAERQLSPEDVVLSEGVRGVFHDATRQIIIFEKIRSGLDAQKDVSPFLFRTPREDSRSELLLVEGYNGESIRRIGSDANGSLFLPQGNNKTSPDGRLVAVYELKGWNLRLGLYDLETDDLRIFDYPIRYEYRNGLSFFWRGNDEIVVLLNTDVHDQRFHQFTGTFGLASLWKESETAWSDSASTASVIGGGRYLKTSHRPAQQSVALLNVREGTTRPLFEDSVERLMLSPSGRYIAATVLREARLADPHQPIGIARPFEFLTALVVYDFETARLQTVDLRKYSLPRNTLSWSPEVDRLRFEVHTGVSDPGVTLSVLYDPSANSLNAFDCQQGALVGLDAIDVSHSTFGFNSLWGGARLLFKCDAHGEVDWWLYEPNESSVKLTNDLDSNGLVPIASVADGFLVLDGNDILRIGRDQMAKVFAILDGGLIGHINHSGFRLPDVASIPFQFRGSGDVERVLYFDVNGSVTASVAVPRSEYAIRKWVGHEGAVFLLNDTEFGSQLRIVRSHCDEEGTVLFNLNEHLVGVYTDREIIKLDYSLKEYGALSSWLVLPERRSNCVGCKYPLIVIPYAGANYSQRYPGDSKWNPAAHAPISAELFASRGYAVLFPSIPLKNPPSDPMIELLPPLSIAIEEAIETDLVDANRIALSGHSYGGYTVLAAATQLDGFRAVIAASSGAVNLTSRYGVFSPVWRYQPMRPLPTGSGWTELGQGRMGAPPWDAVDRYIRNSPLFQADEIDVPIMLIHGSADVISIVESEEMYTALLRQNKDVLFVRYWGEGHGLLNPHNVVDMWTRVFDFLEDNGITPGSKVVK